MGLLVVTGPPGAGKSTVAALLAGRTARAGAAVRAVEARPTVLVLGDDFFSLLGPGMVAPWLPEAHAQNAVVVDAAAAAT
ncbi:hypothetical protein ACQUZK_10205, partial [Streptococcus pyogenes]|uniref:hypothetical protein n=1 Tax=Streptococcus pyogenes TaxID=1314 RepID=UPI003DA01AC6